MVLCDNVHRAEQLSPDVWRISEAGIVNSYLITGRSRALLVDAGCGAGNLPACVGQLTDLPVSLAVTHRHPDHVGGAWAFGRYFACEDDFGYPYDLMCKETVCRAIIRMRRQKITLKKPDDQETAAVKISDGHVFDLGDRQIQAFQIPGHTRGSLFFVDAHDHFIFAGDGLGPKLWMDLPGCTNLRTWIPAAGKILPYFDSGYRIFTGHGGGRLRKEQFGLLLQFAEELEEKYEAGVIRKNVGTYPSDSVDVSIRYAKKNLRK